MKKELKMLARKTLYQGKTQELYEKLSKKKTESLSKMSDEEYIRYRYREDVGGELDLDNPETLNEKLNWLKLHNRNPEYTRYVDKYAVKQYVADTVGEDYIIPLIGVWDNPDKIDFDGLPNQFVLKVTHDSGGRIICTDKNSLDVEKAKEKLKSLLSTDYFAISREYPYRDVRRRIIAEPYVESLGREDTVEYKLSVFNGTVRMITVCKGPAHDSLDVRTNDHYDRDGNVLPFYVYYKNSDVPVPLPPQTDEMIEVAEKLAGDIPYVRVDFYVVDEKVLFGEMTFFTWGGFMQFSPPEWDLKMGEWLRLPEIERG